jgi:hypothetical protein
VKVQRPSPNTHRRSKFNNQPATPSSTTHKMVFFKTPK